MIRTFKKLLGNGRAWLLLSDNIYNFSCAIIKPFEELKDVFYSIAYCCFPTQNRYSNNLERDLINFENQFNINVAASTIDERAQNVESQWRLSVGAQGYGYIEKVLIKAGISVKIYENIPAVDYASQMNVQYGTEQYGDDIQYGEGPYKIIGNGILKIGNTMYDPAQIVNYKKTFLIVPQETLTNGQIEIMTDLVLKHKPLNNIGLLLMS